MKIKLFKYRRAKIVEVALFIIFITVSVGYIMLEGDSRFLDILIAIGITLFIVTFISFTRAVNEHYELTHYSLNIYKRIGKSTILPFDKILKAVVIENRDTYELTMGIYDKKDKYEIILNELQEEDEFIRQMESIATNHNFNITYYDENRQLVKNLRKQLEHGKQSQRSRKKKNQ